MKRYLFGVFCLAAAMLGIQPAPAFESSTYLPLGRSLVPSDQDLPIPMGIGVYYYYQRQGYDISRITTVPDVTPLITSPVEVRARVNEVNAKLDAWVLPFLNLFLVGGWVEENTKVFNIPMINSLEINDRGGIYGGGATLAYGFKHVWGSLTAADTYADLNQSDSWIQAFILTPKVGIRYDTPWPGKGFNFWIGGMFQKATEEHSGDYNVPQFGVLHYEVKLEEKEPWNILVGAGTDLWGRLGMEVEAGTGDREQVLTSLTFRF